MSSKKFGKGARPDGPGRDDGRDAEDAPARAEGMEAEAVGREETAENAADAGEASAQPDRDGADGSGTRDGVSDAAPDGPTPSSGEDARDPAAADVDEELAALRRERDAYLDMARRERADFDNYRKRIERDIATLKRESLADFLKDFFGPLDDMDRVLIESEKTHSFEALVAGVRIMEENFWRALARAGVRKIDAKGKQFNPELHEAMAAVPSADAPPNTILEVYEQGYKLHDRVLRPARVVVSREP